MFDSLPLQEVIRERKLEFFSGHRPVFVDYRRKAVIFSNGAKMPFKVLVADLPTKPAQYLIESKLATENRFA